MLLAIVVLALPVSYLVCLIAALNSRPGWGTGFLMVSISLTAALLSAYAAVLALAMRFPGADAASKMSNNIAAIVISGPLGGIIALSIIWGVARLRRR